MTEIANNEEMFEELTEEQERAIDEALNQLALDTLSFMNDRVVQNPAIPAGERAYIMLHACEAVGFNIIKHIADQAGVDAREIAERTKTNLLNALESYEDHDHSTCGHDHSHDHEHHDH